VFTLLNLEIFNSKNVKNKKYVHTWANGIGYISINYCTYLNPNKKSFNTIILYPSIHFITCKNLMIVTSILVQHVQIHLKEPKVFFAKRKWLLWILSFNFFQCYMGFVGLPFSNKSGMKPIMISLHRCLNPKPLFV